MKRPELSIIIVSYNTRELLRDCLLSLLGPGKPGRPFEVIVVDNASTDGTVEMLEKDFKKVVLIKNRENAGFGRANNTGIKSARGDFLLLLNSDTVVKKGAVDRLLEFIKSRPKAGIAGPKLLYGDGTVQPSVSTFPNLWREFLRMFRIKKIVPREWVRKVALEHGIFGPTVRSYFMAELPSTIEVDAVNGACMMIRREAMDAAGGFDENYFMYVEDMDLCRTFRDKGWKIFYYPDAEIFHWVGKSSGGTFRDQSPLSYKSLFYYYRKHHGKLYEKFVRSMVITALCFRSAFHVLIRPAATIRGRNETFNSYIKIINFSINV